MDDAALGEQLVLPLRSNFGTLPAEVVAAVALCGGTACIGAISGASQAHLQAVLGCAKAKWWTVAHCSRCYVRFPVQFGSHCSCGRRLRSLCLCWEEWSLRCKLRFVHEASCIKEEPCSSDDDR